MFRTSRTLWLWSLGYGISGGVDNVTADPGAGGSVFATDDIGGVHYPRTKVGLGADGAAVDQIAVSAALDSAGAGIAPAAILGQLDDVATATVTENQFAPVRLSTRRALLVEGVAGGTAVPISAASLPSHAVTNAGTFAVQVDNTVTVASHAVTNAGTFAAQVTSIAAGDNNVGNVDIVTVPAPLSTTGTGTEATALRVTIATDSTGVLSVDDNGGVLTVDGTVTANLAAGTNNIGDVDVLTIAAGDNNIGNVDVASIAAGDNNIGNVDVVTVPADPFGANADAASATGSISAKLRFIAGTGIPVTNTVTVASHAVTNAGTFATQVDGAALTALQLIDNPVFVDGAAFTPATSSVMVAGFEADEASTASVDEGDAGAARMTLTRKLIVTPQPHGLGGLTIFKSLDLDESEEEVSATACSVYGVWVTNTATATRWLHFYNLTAANTTVGTSVPVITIGIPGNATDDIAGNFGPGGMGIQFSTALSVAATTGFADNDAGAPGANDIIIAVFYQA